VVSEAEQGDAEANISEPVPTPSDSTGGTMPEAEDPKTEVAETTTEQNSFEPKIIAFLCNWCSYAGADLAGVSRFQYPPQIRIIRVMCSTRIDPITIFEAFEKGADGVMVTGCHLGDCHYISGNYHTVNKFNLVKKLLDYTSLENDRLKLEWVSASEGQRWADVVEAFTNKIKALGPTPINGTEEKSDLILNEILSAKQAVSDFRLRSMVGREKQLIDEGNVYGDKISEDEMDQLLDRMIKDEYIRSRILLMVEKKPCTVQEMGDHIGISSEEIFKHVARLWKRQIILPEGHKGESPLFIKAGTGGS
jgi:coenzyme F420-reducing hydrogenase delta subunit